MTTAKREAKKTAGNRRPAMKVTSSFNEIQTVLASGADAVLVVGTSKRSEVRVKAQGMTRASKVGPFGFLEYWPEGHVGRIRVFVDDRDTGVERRSAAAALVYAVTVHAMAERDLGPLEGGSGPDAIPFMAESVCRLFGVVNH